MNFKSTVVLYAVRRVLISPLAPLGEAATFAARPPPAPAPDPTPGRRRAFQSPASLSSLFQGPACERRVISRRRVCNHGRHALPFGSVLPIGRVIFTSRREKAFEITGLKVFSSLQGPAGKVLTIYVETCVAVENTRKANVRKETVIRARVRTRPCCTSAVCCHLAV